MTLSSVDLSPISEIVCVEVAAREMTLMTALELVLRARQLAVARLPKLIGRAGLRAASN